MKIIPKHINDRVTYNPETGLLFKDSVLVSHVTLSGYVELRFNTTKYYAHRVAWFIVTGEQPLYIDHINGG